MKKTRMEKGITLIALIITIVVLLILAAVAISSITNDGILNYAQNAAKDYNQAVKNEQTILDYYESYLGGVSEKWTQEGNVLKKTNADGTITQLQIGDKVAYNEGTGKTSTIDPSFAIKDLEWRVLGINSKGQIELISTQPTNSTLTLSGEEDWLKAEENLDTLCNELYANGEGVTARSLKAGDLDKLAGILTDAAKKEIDANYGTMWRYKYDPIAVKIQYSTSTDNGANWTAYEDSTQAKFKEPGKAEINSTNYQDAEGNPIVSSEQKYITYNYIISSKVTQTTSDGISIADLITQGLNDTNNAASGTYVSQYLSTRAKYCDYRRTGFSLFVIKEGKFDNIALFESRGGIGTLEYAVRPVVTIPASASLTKVDGIWQVNV